MQLLRALDDPAFLVIVHLDENSSREYKAVVRAVVAGSKRASLASSPVPCSWGGAVPGACTVHRRVAKNVLVQQTACFHQAPSHDL